MTKTKEERHPSEDCRTCQEYEAEYHVNDRIMVTTPVEAREILNEWHDDGHPDLNAGPG